MINLAILGNENPKEIELWIKACKTHSDRVKFDVINLTSSDWFEKIIAKKYDFYLCKPPGLSALYKQLYDERISILVNYLKQPIYPSLNEILIYENKRYLNSWLKVNKLPHPKTSIFYNMDEALVAIKDISFPVVGKTNIGASGSGVKIFHKKHEVENYLYSAFRGKGVSQRWGPNFNKRGILKRGFQYVVNPSSISSKADLYKKKRNEIQKGFVLIQEYIEHDFEWRVVVIGQSYFAHKKLKSGGKASGSTLKQYDNPPLKLFDFAKDIMDRFGFFSQAIDLFETTDGQLLINEMQCIFGQSDPHQMLVDGTPGRYLFVDDKWKFEAGDFNTLESYNLRLSHIMDLIQKRV